MKRWYIYLALLLAGPALASNVVGGVTVSVDPGLVSVAVHAVLQGDDDSSAVLQIFQRWKDGVAGFDSGMVMVRRHHGPVAGVDATNADDSPARCGEIFEGRILGLTANRVVQFYVQVKDGGAEIYRTSIQETAAKSIPQLQAPAGTVFYVDQVRGSNSYDGKSPTFTAGTNGPKPSITTAITVLANAALQGGIYSGTIFVAPGEYHERDDLAGTFTDTPGGRWSIEGYPGKRDSTILCGASPIMEQGKYNNSNAIVWLPSGHDSTWMAYIPSGTGPSDSISGFVIGDDEWITRKTSIGGVLSDSSKSGQCAGCPNDGELSGWFISGDTTYIKRRNGLAPNAEGKTLHACYRQSLMSVQKRNWRIANLTIRYAGGAIANDAGWSDVSTAGWGIIGGASGSIKSSGMVVDSCTFYGNTGYSVLLNSGLGGAHSDSCIISNCIVRGLGIGHMAYSAGKNHLEETATQLEVEGFNNCVYNNYVTDTFNGIGTQSSIDTLQGKSTEVYGNTVTWTADDGIEPDVGYDINYLVQGNTVDHCGRALSLAPIPLGPLFAIGNTFSRYLTRGIKGASGSAGLEYIWQNTVTSGVAGSAAVDWSPGSTQQHADLQNNILGGSGGPASLMSGPTDTTGIQSNTLNWNLMDSTAASVTDLADLHSSGNSLASLQSNYGWEANGIQRAHVFADSSSNFALGRYSFTRNKARRMAGVNTGLNGPLYNYLGPDHGAVQFVNP